MTKQNKFLFKILLASILIFVLSLAFSKKERSAQKAVDSAILNPSHKNEVNLIEIESEKGSQISLKKQGDFWLLYKTFENGNEISTLADSKIIAALLENTSKIRKIYKITEKENDYLSLGISETQGTSISFSQNNGKLYTKVHFGYSDSLKYRIYFRSDSSKTVYETENDIHQFLTAETNYWTEGQIIPEIKNPVQITMKIKADSEQSLSPITIKLDEKSEDFKSKSHTLLSLRHGNIQDMPRIQSDKNNFEKESFQSETSFLKKISTLTLQDGNGRIARIDFFEKKAGFTNSNKTSLPENDSKNQLSESEISYFYQKSVTPTQIDSQETAFAFYSENALYEISAWTYEKIQSVFKKSAF